MDGWRLLDDDANKSEWFKYDPTTGESITAYKYKNTAKSLDLNKSVQGKDAAKGKEGDWWHVASIPPEVIHRLRVEHDIDIFRKEDGPRLMALLDSNEYAHLRVNTGTIGKRKKII